MSAPHAAADTGQELAILLRSRIPLVVIESRDEARVSSEILVGARVDDDGRRGGADQLKQVLR